MHVNNTSIVFKLFINRNTDWPYWVNVRTAWGSSYPPWSNTLALDQELGKNKARADEITQLSQTVNASPKQMLFSGKQGKAEVVPIFEGGGIFKKRCTL